MNMSVSMKPALESVPLSEKLGVEIKGVDISRIDSETFAKVKDVFDEHGVILLRDQKLTPQELHHFGSLFGPLETHTLLQYTLAEVPEIYVLSNLEEDGKPLGAHNEGIGWHTDLSH